MLLVFLILGFAGSAAGVGVTSVTVKDQVDRDGDGYVSSFTLMVWADARITEKGKKYEGKLFQAKGNPSYVATFGSPGTIAGFNTGMYKESSNSKKVGFDLEFDWNDMKDERDSLDGNVYKNKKQMYTDILHGDRDVDSITVVFWESDTPNKLDARKDERIGAKSIKAPFKGVESPSEDKKQPVSIDSRPSGATLYIGGEKKGKTDWEGGMMPDLKEKKGFVTVRLEKDGYKTLTDRTQLSPPDERDYELKKLKKPIVVDSDPDGATVRVNGQKIGETPVSKEYWVKEDFDLRIEKDGYKTVTIENVEPGSHKAVELESTGDSDSSDTGGSTGTGFYNPYDPVITPDFNSVNYYDNLLTELPDFSGWTYAQLNRSSKKIGAGEAVTLDASGSYVVDGTVVAYRWDFGDGGTRSTASPTVVHSYSSPGNYTVNLTVEGNNGSTASTVKHVVVENLLPKPRIDVGSQQVIEGESVVLDAGRTVDPDGSVVSYSWDFGDGASTGANTRPKVSHTYSSSGSYVVELEAADNTGATETATRTINVLKQNMAPRPQFDVSSKTVAVNEKVSFDASSSADPDGKLTQYYWDFGDGLSGTGAESEHNYSRPGTYKVELTVLDDRRESAAFDKQVTVEAADGQNSKNTAKGSGSSGESDKNRSEGSGEGKGNSGKSSLDLLIEFFKSLF